MAKNPSAEKVVHQIRIVTYAGMAVNLLLVGAKAVGGWCFNSQALLADAVHSLSDLITDFAVIFGVKYWTAPPDSEHPYGHGKIESIISGFIGLALIGVACGLVWEAVRKLISGDIAIPDWSAFGIALVSIVSKEAIFRWTRRVARQVRSQALEANAWHHRSDAISSIPVAVAVGIARIFPGLYFIDHIGAIVVSFFIVHAGWKIISPTLRQLCDTGVSNEDAATIRNIVLTVPGILEVHKIRTRISGMAVFADLHIMVDPDMSVREGHAISHQVRRALVNSGMGIIDVVSHLEPYLPEDKKSDAAGHR